MHGFCRDDEHVPLSDGKVNIPGVVQIGMALRDDEIVVSTVGADHGPDHARSAGTLRGLLCYGSLLKQIGSPDSVIGSQVVLVAATSQGSSEQQAQACELFAHLILFLQVMLGWKRGVPVSPWHCD